MTFEVMYTECIVLGKTIASSIHLYAKENVRLLLSRIKKGTNVPSRWDYVNQEEHLTGQQVSLRTFLTVQK